MLPGMRAAALALGLLMASLVPAGAAVRVDAPVECVTADVLHAQLQEAVDQIGGIGATMGPPGAQPLSDGVRSALGRPPVKVSAVLFWVIGPMVSMTELDPAGCYVGTPQNLPLRDFWAILKALPKP